MSSEEGVEEHSGDDDLGDSLLDMSMAEMDRKLPEGVEDIDASMAGNQIEVTEYVDDIFSYMMDMEVQLAPDADYMSRQSQINPKMRTILINWIADVSHHTFMERKGVFN